MANLCIIPARGKSKRIPRKNIKDFFGKPIIAYSIQAAIDSNLFDEIMVSTEDSEIAKIAKQYGAKIPFLRSKKNADDFATTFDVIQEVLRGYKLKGNAFKNVCCIYPCAPLVTINYLKNGLKTLIDNKYDSVFPVMVFNFPIQRALRLKENNKVEMFYNQYLNSRSQDLEKSYHDAGQFYWMNVDSVMRENRIITSNSGSIIISEMEGQDIDDKSDWKLAEIKYKILHGI